MIYTTMSPKIANTAVLFLFAKLGCVVNFATHPNLAKILSKKLPIRTKIRLRVITTGSPHHIYIHKNKKCGKRGIRTPGPSQVNGFQDRRDRPLRHLSMLFRPQLVGKAAAKVRFFSDIHKYPLFFLLCRAFAWFRMEPVLS